MNNAVLTKAEKIARSKIGYREGPKNNETIFGAWFGMNFQAWCAIFLSWLSDQSGLTYLNKPWRFASTIAARDHAKKNKRWTTTPTVGTYAMMAHSSTTGHVGFVIYLLMRNGQLIVGTIEGNTNDQGAREGNGVWLRERLASSWDGYIVLDQTNVKDQNSPEDDMFDTEDRNKLNQIWGVVAKSMYIEHLVQTTDAIKAALEDANTGGGPGQLSAEDIDRILDAQVARMKE